MDQTISNGIMPKEGWSWGALVFNFYFLIAIKKYKLLWWYLLAFIPLVNIIFFIAFAIYLGMKGHELGVTGGQFANQSEYDGYMKGTDHAGKIVFFVAIICLIIFIILFIALMLLGLLGPHAMPSMMNNTPSLSTY
jgi:hypothetical protein